jgi:penicillin-binding protein 2
VKNGDHGLVKLLKTIETQRGVSYSDDCLSKTADDLMYLAGMTWNPNTSKVLCDANGKTMGSYVRDILHKDMNIATTASFARGWDTQITSIIAQLIWTPNTTIQTGIGQGIVQVTPIAVARYVAAIANGGTVYETHIVDKVTDQSGNVILKQDPVVEDTLGAPEEYLDAIKQGMADVVSGQDGTAKVYFQNFDYKNEIAGKTGTAQVSNIDLEDNSWFVCFAPYDKNDPSVKPEIAIAIYVPHGWKGALSSLVAQDIIQFYLDKEKTK